jgi:hypothetical protein
LAFLDELFVKSKDNKFLIHLGIVKKKVLIEKTIRPLNTLKYVYFLCLGSDETVSFFLPFALLLANTLRPLADDILSMKPCLFLLLRLDG